MNMAEEYSEPQLEKVAVRFKDSEVAYKFKDKVEECIASVKARKKKFGKLLTSLVFSFHT